MRDKPGTKRTPYELPPSTNYPRRNVSRDTLDQLREWAEENGLTMLTDYAPEAMLVDKEGRVALALVGRQRERERFRARLTSSTALARLGIPVYVWYPPNRLEKIVAGEGESIELK